jgi:hypothetical protein
VKPERVVEEYCATVFPDEFTKSVETEGIEHVLGGFMKF